MTRRRTTYRSRPFRGTVDEPATLCLAARNPKNNHHTVDLPYRFRSWAFAESANVRIWEDDTEHMVGWVALQSPFWSVDISVKNGHERCLLPDILDWVQDRIHAVQGGRFGRPTWFATCFPDQDIFIGVLNDNGFSCQSEVGENSWAQVLLCHDRSENLKTIVPPEFEIRSLNGEQEAAAYTAAHRAAFQSDSMTKEWRRRTVKQPQYVRDIDLVAISQEGSIVGFCIGWLHRDGGTTTGQIEPLGVHPDFQKRGLRRALLMEALKRMYNRGASTVCLETDDFRDAAMALYLSTGFRKTREILVYRKDYS